jgi:hypothetical protein
MNKEKKKKILVAILAHMAEEPLSDGNTNIKIYGRMDLLKSILRSLSVFNDMAEIPVVIFDTGDMAEKNVLENLTEFGFDKIKMSSENGFFVDDLPMIDALQTSPRIYLRYKRQSDWNSEFKNKAHRFIEACEAALKYADKVGATRLLAIEGDTVLFGQNYIEKLREKLGNKTIANCGSETDAKKVYTDFWIADTKKALAIFDKVFAAMKPPYHSELAFSEVLTDRVDLNDFMIGQKSLDQKIESQKNRKNLPENYFERHPLSWVTHPSGKQIKIIENHLLWQKMKKERRLV